MIDERHSSAGSNVSFDDQIYDSEFEHELQLFKKKLERRESSSENISRSRQRECKLIPNVSAEWIEQLQQKLKNYCGGDKATKVTLQCMTTSTAGVSLNSPPATERAYEMGELNDDADS